MSTATAANYNLTTVVPREDWQHMLAGVPAKGGFFLDRAVKSFLYQHYRTDSRRYPVIVVVTDNPSHWRLYEDYASWQPAFPESAAYYRLRTDGMLQRLSLLDGGVGEESDSVAQPPSVEVLAWPGWGTPKAYLPDDGRDGIVLTEDSFTVPPVEMEGSDWEIGLSLEAMSLALMMNPGGYRARELAILRGSLSSGVMTMATSYIVLENEAQEAAMRAKQQRIMTTDKVIDADETDDVSAVSRDMAEPSLPIVMLLGAAILLVVRFIRNGLFRRT